MRGWEGFRELVTGVPPTKNRARTLRSRHIESHSSAPFSRDGRSRLFVKRAVPNSWPYTGGVVKKASIWPEATSGNSEHQATQNMDLLRRSCGVSPAVAVLAEVIASSLHCMSTPNSLAAQPGLNIRGHPKTLLENHFNINTYLSVITHEQLVKIRKTWDVWEISNSK